MSEVVWTSQVTHTAVAVRGGELWSATYTVGTDGMVAVGMVFDAPSLSGLTLLSLPKRRYDLGRHTDEAAARGVCTLFCEGKLMPSEVVVEAVAVDADAAADATAEAPAVLESQEGAA